jgi:hypothetical protein
MSKRHSPLLAAGLLFAFCSLALPGGRIVTLLKGTFDKATINKLADIGRLDVTSGADRFDLDADTVPPAFGQVAVYDDTGTQGELNVTVEGTFADGLAVATGPISVSFELVAEQLDAEFEVSVVMDNPSSDLYPVGGTGSGGGLTLGGLPSGVTLAPHSPVWFQVTLDRDSPTKNWTWSGTLQYLGTAPNGAAATMMVGQSGVFPGSAGKAVDGVVFQKVAGPTGIFSLDDVTITATK